MTPVQPAGGGGTVTGPTINLPPGVVVQPGRETAQTTATGQVVQGVVFPIVTPAGSTTSVFVPYGELHNTAAVEQLIAQRAEAVIAISG